MRYPLFISLSVAMLATLFAFQNMQFIRVRFLTFELDGRLALVILITLALGVLVGYMASLPRRWKARNEINTLKKQLQAVQAAVALPPAPAAEPAAPPASSESAAAAK